jgi:hypothetical protein
MSAMTRASNRRAWSGGKGRVSGPVPDDADGAQEFDPVGIEWSRLEDRFELNLDADLPGDQQPAAV